MNYEQQIAELEATIIELEKKHTYFAKKKIKGAGECTAEITRIKLERDRLITKQRTEQLARETNYKTASISSESFNPHQDAFQIMPVDWSNIEYANVSVNWEKPSLWQRVKSWFGGV